MSKNYIFYKISDDINQIPFSPDGLAEIEISGKQICIAQHNETLFACAAKCPHAGGTMAEGYLDAAGNITCPLHRYKFSLDKGRNTSGEGYFLKTYPVEKRADGIYVGIAGGMFDWLK